MIIYKITNIVNGKSYIGQTIGTLTSRVKRHFNDAKRGSKTYFHRSIIKYGHNNFTQAVMDNTCKTKDELDEMEFHYIKQYHSHFSENGYNLTYGGDGTQLFGKNNGMFGKNHTIETRKLISKNLPVRLGKENSFFGKTHTQETINKISITKKKQSKGSNNPNSKKWIIITPNNNMVKIECLSTFCKENNLNYDCMRAVSLGRIKSNNHKGYKCIKA